MNAFAQTLVWATMAAFLYVVWFNQQGTSPLRIFQQTRHLRYVLTSLQTLWIIIGLSVLISVLLLSFPPLVRAASTAVPPCMDYTSPQATGSTYAYRRPSAGICASTEPSPSDTYPAKHDNTNRTFAQSS